MAIEQSIAIILIVTAIVLVPWSVILFWAMTAGGLDEAALGLGAYILLVWPLLSRAVDMANDAL